MRRQVDGILLLDKPAQITSNHALQKVKHLFYAKKAGHTGSLDPIATGMLPLCFGQATKFSQFLLESDKSYYVVAKLGIETRTGDSEGEVLKISKEFNVSRRQLEVTLKKFLGEQQQIPPMYSAIKHNGKPLYELARKGIEIERLPRRINVSLLELVEFNHDTVSFHINCSKGTYIRTLIADIGRDLGLGAHVIELRRLAVTPYANTTMYTLSALQTIHAERGFEGLRACLLPVETAVQIYPAVKLSTAAAFYLRMGQPVRTNLPFQSQLVRLFSEDARFLGIGEVLTDGRVKPYRLVS